MNISVKNSFPRNIYFLEHVFNQIKMQTFLEHFVNLYHDWRSVSVYVV